MQMTSAWWHLQRSWCNGCRDPSMKEPWHPSPALPLPLNQVCASVPCITCIWQCRWSFLTPNSKVCWLLLWQKCCLQLVPSSMSEVVCTKASEVFVRHAVQPFAAFYYSVPVAVQMGSKSTKVGNLAPIASSLLWLV